MTDNRKPPLPLEEIEATLAKATPGDWWICVDDSGDRPMEVPSIQAPRELDCAVIHWDGFWQEYWQSARGHKEMLANAALIVLLRNHAPALLSELRTLRSRLQVAEEAFKRVDGEAPTGEPPPEPTVSFRYSRPDDEQAEEAIEQAFQEGCARGRWEAAANARSALSAIKGEGG